MSCVILSIWTNELEVVEGMQFDRGFLSPYFITDTEKQRIVLKDAYGLVHDRSIATIRDLLPLLEQVSKEAKPLLLIAEDVTGEALATLVINAIRGVLKTCAVKGRNLGRKCQSDHSRQTARRCDGRRHGGFDRGLSRRRLVNGLRRKVSRVSLDTMGCFDTRAATLPDTYPFGL